MKTLTRNAFFAFAAAAMLTACSRPYATLQRTPTEHYTQQTKVQPVAEQQVTALEAPAVATVAEPTPAAQIEAVQQAVEQLEAYAATDTKLAGNKKLEKRMTRVKTMLAEVAQQKTLSTNSLQQAKKMSLKERIMTKKIDKQIRKHIAPDEAKALDRSTRAGIILGIVGLLLALLFGGVLGLLGLLMLIGGIVLILVGVLRTV